MTPHNTGPTGYGAIGAAGPTTSPEEGGFWRKFIAGNLGLLLVAGSEFFFAFMHLSVKILNSIDTPVSTFELIFVRMVITYAFCLIYMVSTGVSDPILGPKGVRLALFYRGLGGSIGLYGIYYSLQYLSLSDATVLTFLSPMCTAIAGAIFLGEHLRLSQLVASFFSLFGVVLIARPPGLFGDSLDQSPTDDGITPAQRLIAVGMAMIGVLGATLAFTSLRAVGKRAHTMHSMVSFAGQSIILSGAGMVLTGSTFVIPTKLSWLAMLVMIGVFGFVAQILLTMGLQRETAGRGTMAVYTQIVFATILQKVFLKTTPPFLSVVGTMIILSSALYTALNKVKVDSTITAVPEVDEAQRLLPHSEGTIDERN
ncbi:integral membrane protein DUF6 [Coprinopsis marcescibilis]|uniref:Integral membrane protein DUF6 n=1 Tax=Coprinopsis marcescibilis TaxID=230819 RepID=A0A5C3KE08_COPMA|nr:integral membrane protein DUF6 [Coprinopsis marcescibilis]